MPTKLGGRSQCRCFLHLSTSASRLTTLATDSLPSPVSPTGLTTTWHVATSGLTTTWHVATTGLTTTGLTTTWHVATSGLTTTWHVATTGLTTTWHVATSGLTTTWHVATSCLTTSHRSTTSHVATSHRSTTGLPVGAGGAQSSWRASMNTATNAAWDFANNAAISSSVILVVCINYTTVQQGLLISFCWAIPLPDTICQGWTRSVLSVSHIFILTESQRRTKTLPTIRSQDNMCTMAHKWDTARTQVKWNHAATRKTCVPASTAAIQVPILPARTKSRSRTANKTTAPSTVDYHQSTTYLTNRWCHHYRNTINQPIYPNSVMAVHDSYM